MILIGTERYRYVLQRALARARGEQVHDDWMSEVVLDVAAYVPSAFIPESDIRLEIYRCLARLQTPEELEEARDELTDRFGALPQELEGLLELTHLRILCRRCGIAAVHGGPAAVALTPVAGAIEKLLHLKRSHRSGDRVILPIAETVPAVRLRRLLAALDPIAG